METRILPELKPKLKVCETCGNRVIEFGEIPENKYTCSKCNFN